MSHKDEEFLISESAELSFGENSTWVAKLLAAFPAFKSKNYQLYFAGQLVSMIGTWLQVVAEGWLVLTLTNSAFLIGLVTACATVPSLLFSLYGGVIVDRLPKKYILLFTQTSAMILALLYGTLAILHRINIYEIMGLAFLLGTVNAVDIPARQSLVVELVDDRESLNSAVALNAGIFNAARVVGPGIAGLIIALVGSGGAFLLNGVSYIAAIGALYFMTLSIKVEKHDMHPIQAIKDGIRYSFSHPIMRILLIFTAVVSIFGWSYTTEMPYIAKHTFNLDATGLGYLYGANGLGALIGTFLLSAFSKKFSKTIFILGGCWLFTLSIFLFSFTHILLFGLVTLFFAGVGLVAQFATVNTTMQHMVEDTMRGRVMSIYSLLFVGLIPFGSFEIGWVSEKFGTSLALQVSMVVVFAFSLYVFFKRKKIRAEHEEYLADRK